MKRILIYLLMSYPIISFSQTQAKSKRLFVYGETGLGKGTGTYFVPSLTLNGIWKDNIISIAHHYALRDARNIPDDYVNPYFALFSDGYPHQHVSMWGAMYGKVFYTKSPLLRFIVKGGVAINTIATPDNYQPPQRSSSFSTTYGFDYRILPSFIANPAIEFPIGAGFGVAVDAFANLNPLSNYAGIGLDLIFGNVGPKIISRYAHRQVDK